MFPSRKLAIATADAGGKSGLIVRKGGRHSRLAMNEEITVLAEWIGRQPCTQAPR